MSERKNERGIKTNHCVVWCPADGETEDSGRHYPVNEPEIAAELYVEACPDTVEATEVSVRGPDGVVRVFKVDVDWEPVYSASEVVLS